MIHSKNYIHDSNISFPKLMINIHSGIIVLFLNENEGTLLHGGSEAEHIGTHYKDSIWEMTNFIDYNGTLHLKNSTY